MNKINGVSIIIPCFNEENSVGEVVKEVHAIMRESRYNYEIIIIDDNSSDKTSQISQKLDVRYYKNKKNLGAGASRSIGINYSLYPIIVYIDADLSYTASDIPRLLSHFPDSDHVIGYRDCEMGYFRFLRKIVKAISRLIASILIWEYIPDLNSGLRAFRKDKILPYLNILPPGFSCVTTMTLVSYCTGQKVSYISTHYKKRVGKSKFHPIKDTFLLFFMIFKTVFILKPLSLLLLFLITFTSIMLPFLVSNPLYLITLELTAFSIYIILSMYLAKDCMRFE